MKTKITYSLLAAAAACSLANAQTTAYTTPVGYVSLGGTQFMQPAVDAETDQTISLPLKNAAVFSGEAASSSSTSISFSGTPFSNLELVATPHIVEVTSGPKAGLQGLVTAATSSALTIAPSDSSGDFSSIGAASVAVRPAFTVAGLMANSNPPAGTQFLAYTGTASGINVPNDIILEWDGANWIDIVNTGEAADNTVLYNGESFIVRNPTQTPITELVIAGEVITNKLQLELVNIDSNADQDIPMAYNSTVPETVAASGITALANPGDQIIITDASIAGIFKSASVLLEFDGADWIDIVNTGEAAQNTTLIGGGIGFTYQRKATSNPTVWTQNPSYISSL
jgi:uncharacterized protein (TIGR02597 family)